MILDNLTTTLTDYSAINPKIGRAIEWLKSRDLTELVPGQVIEIDGPRISAQIQAYSSIDPSEARFETHRLFIDIQVITSGQETIYWAPLSRLPEIHTPYDYEKDLIFYSDPSTTVPIHMEAGDFAIFFPSDGHKPKCFATGPEPVGKIVVKVAV